MGSFMIDLQTKFHPLSRGKTADLLQLKYAVFCTTGAAFFMASSMEENAS